MDLMSKTAERDAVPREYDDKKVQLEDLNKNIAKTQTIKGMQFIDSLEKEKETLVRKRFRSNVLIQSKNHQSTATRSARAKGTMN
jgi:hypothetical protein